MDDLNVIYKGMCLTVGYGLGLLIIASIACTPMILASVFKDDRWILLYLLNLLWVFYILGSS